MLSFLDGRQRMGLEVGFQGRVMRLDLTHRPLEGHRFEARHSTVPIELEVVAQGIVGDADQLRDLPMG